MYAVPLVSTVIVSTLLDIVAVAVAPEPPPPVKPIVGTEVNPVPFVLTIEGYSDVVRAAQPVRDALDQNPAILAPCHCDPLCENFLDDGDRIDNWCRIEPASE